MCIGKTNLDQFATGLVGTRSPYGAVRNAVDPTRISGGSSSGSAVAVALGLVDLALGTDTAGSGRVPAALNGIVGYKATFGLVSTGGTVPACASFDCVTVLAPAVAVAERAMAELTGPRGDDGSRREYPQDVPLGASGRPVIARPGGDVLAWLDPERRSCYEAALSHLEALGCAVVDLDLDPFLDAGLLLYQGAFVAERYAAVGAWIAVHPDEVDPTVGAIISAAAALGAPQMASDIERLAALRRTAAEEWHRAGADSLLLPTVTLHPTLSEVAADPIGVNTQLGRLTTFLNLLDMCAVAVPFGMCAGLPFGVSCIGPAFTDLVQSDVASRLEQGGIIPATSRPTATSWQTAAAGRPAPPGVTLGVVGAHLSGQPLNHQLTDRGARLLGATTTAHSYRLFALDTVPAKPGLVRVPRWRGPDRGGDLGALSGWFRGLRGPGAVPDGHRLGGAHRRRACPWLPLRAVRPRRCRGHHRTRGMAGLPGGDRPLVVPVERRPAPLFEQGADPVLLVSQLQVDALDEQFRRMHAAGDGPGRLSHDGAGRRHNSAGPQQGRRAMGAALVRLDPPLTVGQRQCGIEDVPRRRPLHFVGRGSNNEPRPAAGPRSWPPRGSHRRSR